MTAAQEDMGQIVDWLSKSSRYYKAPMFGDVAVGPYASILSIDPDTRTMPDLSELAEGGLVFLVPTQQLVKVPVPHLEFQPDGHPPLLERVKHMFSHKLGVELPDVLVAVSDDIEDHKVLRSVVASVVVDVVDVLVSSQSSAQHFLHDDTVLEGVVAVSSDHDVAV